VTEGKGYEEIKEKKYYDRIIKSQASVNPKIRGVIDAPLMATRS